MLSGDDPFIGFCPTYLHRYQSVVDHDFLSEEVGAYCRFVACAELLVDLCRSCKRPCVVGIYVIVDQMSRDE